MSDQAVGVPSKAKEDGRQGLVQKTSSSPLAGGVRGGEAHPVAKRSKISITLDTSPEDVVELDSKGFELFFEHDVGRFKELPEETVRELGYENRVSYGIARGVWLALKKEEVNGPTPGLQILPPKAASAGRRLEIMGQKTGTHYCWKRPDELVQAGMNGYKIVQGDGVQTFAERGDGTHRVGAFGQDELVLMQIPQEKFEAIEAEAGAKSRARLENQTNNAEAAIREAGGVPFIPKEKDGIAWREGVEEGNK